MKILVPVTYGELGGSQVFLLKLMDAFAADGDISFSVLLFQDGPLRAALEQRGIPCRLMEFSWRKPWTVWAVIREIRRIRPDLIYLHASRFIAGIAKLMKIPCVERINMSRVGNVRGWCSHPWIDRFCTSLNTRALAVSAAIEKQLLDRGVPPEKLVVVRNFVETERFHHPENRQRARQLLGIPDGRFLVINVGRFSPQKTQRDFLAAAAIALKQNPDLFFLLIGDGPLKAELLKQTAELGIENQVRFLPFRKDVEIVYQAADLMLHTAHWAPLDNVLLEAMAAGLPVVASDVDGTNEVIFPEKTGLLFPVGDTAAAAALLLRTAADPELAERLGSQAFEYVRTHHSIGRVKSQFRQLFEQLTERRS